MPRDVNAATLAHLAQRQTSVIQMVYLDILGDPVRVHSDVGSFPWGGQAWLGIGAIGSIDAIREDESLEANTTRLGMRFAGERAPIMVAAARSSNHVNRQAVIYYAARDMVTGDLIGDPVVALDGEMQTLRFAAGIDGDGAAVLEVTDGRSADNRSVVQNFSNADQQERHPGDLGSKFMEDALLFNEHWGPGGPDTNKVHTGGGGGGGPGPGPRFRYR